MSDAITPDTKDWTWVLNSPCAECGLNAASIAVADVPGLVRAATPAWRAALARSGARERPTPETWSVTEYGAHVRDVYRIFDERLALMIAQDEPTYPNWDQDATALASYYAEADPDIVADELAAAAEAIAARFDTVRPDSYGRRGLRSNGSEFTVTTLAQYFWHDVAHHLYDVGAA